MRRTREASTSSSEATSSGVTADCPGRAPRPTRGFARATLCAGIQTGKGSRALAPGRRQQADKWSCMQSGEFRCEMARGVSVACLRRAFCGVDIPVDRLKVWQAPIIEQLQFLEDLCKLAEGMHFFGSSPCRGLLLFVSGQNCNDLAGRGFERLAGAEDIRIPGKPYGCFLDVKDGGPQRHDVE
jgi:hypothetical protein